MGLALEYKRRIEKQQAAKRAEKALESKEAEQIEKLADNQKQYDLLLHSLDTDLKRISSLPQGVERENLKRDELIPKYMPYIEAYLEKGEIYRNEVLSQVMIWLFDTENIDEALKLANICIEQKQSMPKRFSRNVQTFVADAVLDWVASQRAKEEPIEPYFSRLNEVVHDWPVHDVIKMKYVKTAAQELEDAEKYAEALELYKKAQVMCPREAKCKTAIKNCEKHLISN